MQALSELLASLFLERLSQLKTDGSAHDTALAAAVATAAEGFRQVMARAALRLQLTYSTQQAVGVGEHVTHSMLCAVTRFPHSARQQAAGRGHTSSPTAVSGAWARPAPSHCVLMACMLHARCSTRGSTVLRITCPGSTPRTCRTPVFLLLFSDQPLPD